MSDEHVPPPPGAPPPPPPPPAGAPPGAPPPPPAGAPPPPMGGGMGGGGGAVSENRTIMIVLAYFGPLALIPLLVEKDDHEVQWHSKHGLVLFGAEVVLWVVLFIVGMVLAAIFAPLGCLLSIFSLFLSLGVLVLHVMCIMKGVKGERLKLPVLSDFPDKF